MPRTATTEHLLAHPLLDAFGLSVDVIGQGVTYVYDILDRIDDKLTEVGGERLAELVEAANLSSIVGNLYRGGVVRASGGRFIASAPHHHPDLLGRAPGCENIEIKVALEGNNPKGHLVKPGPHMTIRYVLADANGEYKIGKENRGNVVWIWEVRVGRLTEDHFNVSNTDGDSGKTAVVNAAGMSAFQIVYCDVNRSPLGRRGAAYRRMVAMFKS